MITLAVMKQKLIDVIGTMSELDTVTEVLGKTRSFQPDNALAFYSDTAGFSPLSEINPYAKALSGLADAVKQIGFEKETAKLSYPDDPVLPVGDWNGYASSFAGSVAEFRKKKQECEAKIRHCQSEIGKIGHFDGLNLDLGELKRCEFVKLRFGSLPKESYDRLTRYEENPYVAFFPSKTEDSLYWGMYCAPVDQIESVDQVFAGLYFEQVSFDDEECGGTVASVMESYRQTQKREEEKLAAVGAEVQSFWSKEKHNFLGVYEWLSEKYAFFNIRRYAAHHGDSFILVGWIPAKREKAVRAKLDTLQTVKYSLDDASDPQVIRHSPPIQLRNHQLFSPFEFFIKIYGLPAYNEFDPTAIVALTYVLFFGIMFADLGQGLCVALLGWLLWKKKNSELGRVMVPCGISSAIVGVLFGSVFGFEHALDPLYRVFFGLPQKPISVMDSPTMVVSFTIGLGVFMVILAILTNIVSALRRGDLTSGLFGPNGMAGLTFYVSLLVGFGGQMLYGWQIVGPAFVVCFLVLPILLMMFREVLGGLLEGKPDWKPEKWGETIMENFFEVFEFILSYLTNTISFIRIGAYVLVHAGMMMVIFQLAGDTLSVGYFLVIAVGNAFVIALEGLLSGVQSLRLEFYEMFSRFYDGSGRPFAPVAVGQEP